MRRFLIFLPLIGTLAGCIDSPKPSKPQKKQSIQQPVVQNIPQSQEYRRCVSELSSQRAIFTPIEDKYFSSTCTNVGTLQLSALTTDRATVPLSGLGPVTCSMASPFAGWARFGVDRAAQQLLGSRLAKIETFGSYSCRNVAGTNRRSGHSTANAIDVSGFVLEDGRRITILKHWNGGTPAERQFLRTVHGSACKRFGTTLGPAYNAAHADHLHIEADKANFCR